MRYWSATDLVDLATKKCSNPEEVDDSIASNPRHPRSTHGSMHYDHEVAAFCCLFAWRAPLRQVCANVAYTVIDKYHYH